MTDRIAAALAVIERIETQRFVVQVRGPRIFLRIGGEVAYAQMLHQIGNMQAGLDPLQRARHRMRGHLRNHRRAHAVESMPQLQAAQLQCD